MNWGNRIFEPNPLSMRHHTFYLRSQKTLSFPPVSHTNGYTVRGGLQNYTAQRPLLHSKELL